MSKQKQMWNARYGQTEYVYGTAPNDFLLERYSAIPCQGCVLCLAEGEGRNAVFMAEQGYNVTGVDIADEGRSKAQKLASARSVQISYDVADLNTYDMGQGVWDGIVAVFCHMPSADRPALFQNIRSALRPGGAMVFEAYHEKQVEYGTGGPKAKDLLYTREELEDAFQGWNIEVSQEGEREVIEGSLHNGKAYTVQFIAHKPL
ncbi:MAG: class I SAM-dependent methyltransferase [Planktomarina sp.]